MANRWGNNGNSKRLHFFEIQNHRDSDCSHEIKRHLLLGNLPGGSMVKSVCLHAGDLDSISGSRRFPWRRKWQPTPVFLPGKSPWTEEPGRATVHGFSKSRTGPSDFSFFHSLLLGRKAMTKLWQSYDKELCI